MNGGPGNSVLEEKLRGKLEAMSAEEAGDSAGGFEPPPEESTQNAPSDDDSQFAALQDLVTKMGPIGRVQSGIWFLVIKPTTKHREEVQRMIDQNATQMQPAEQTDFQEYMGVRRSLAGASYSTRVDRWSAFTRAKPRSSFAELANREVQYIRSVLKDRSAEKSSHRNGILTGVLIVVLVLLLVGAIVFGASK